jgi:hypothetical protein
LDGEQHVAAFHPHHIFRPIICNDKVSLTESVGHVGLTVWLRDPSRTFVLPHARTLFRLVATSVRQNKHRSCCYSPPVSPHPLLRMRTRRRARVCSCRPTSVAIDVRTVPTADGTHGGRRLHRCRVELGRASNGVNSVLPCLKRRSAATHRPIAWPTTEPAKKQYND